MANQSKSAQPKVVKPRLYSYVVAIDDGAAPNPFGGVCTLAICKPTIRKGAVVGDWILGTGSKRTKLKDGFTYNLGSHVVYAMRVTGKVNFAKYEQMCRKGKLAVKVPAWRSNKYHKRVGDCMYQFDKNGNFKLAMLGIHNQSKIKRRKVGLIKKDLSVDCVLLSNEFYYFGDCAPRLPRNLEDLVHAQQNSKVNTSKAKLNKLEKWLNEYPENKILGRPQQQYKLKPYKG